MEGVPFASTFPHFMHSSRFLSGFQGLNPDPAKHTSYFDIEKVMIDNFFDG